MPTNQRLGPNDVNDLENGREPAIQLDEEKAVAIGQPNPAPALPLQHDQLLPQRRDLSLEPRLRLNGETKMARTNRRSPITRSAYAIRSPTQRMRFSVQYPSRSQYLNRKFSRESWSIAVQPINFMSRSISARNMLRA